MAEITGPISTLPNAHHDLPDGTMCDEHPDRPAVARIQGETDSFGAELHDLCAECVKAHRDEARKPNIGECAWCDAADVARVPTRDYEEGTHGPVYYVCAACKKRQDDAISAELNRYGGAWDD